MGKTREARFPDGTLNFRCPGAVNQAWLGIVFLCPGVSTVYWEDQLGMSFLDGTTPFSFVWV